MKHTPLRTRRPYKPVAVQRHHDRVAGKGCLVCGRHPAEVHHVTAYADKPGRFSRDDWKVVPLCPPHHRKAADPFNRLPGSVEGLGHRGFYKKYGIDLLAEALRLTHETKA